MPRKARVREQRLTAVLSCQVGHTCVVHCIGEQVGAFRTQTEACHRVCVSSHRVSELVLAKVPHLSDTTLQFSKETAKTIGTAVSKAFHTGQSQAS